MTTANLATCKRLFELSGWKSDIGWAETSDGDYYFTKNEINEPLNVEIPAYDLGYLLRKLPTLDKGQRYLAMEASPIGYAFGYAEYGELTGTTATADNPEDACALLLINLLQEGIITK